MAKILIVDDSKNICKMGTLAFTCVGHEVQSTQDVFRGLKLFDDGVGWDLTLVDQRMPLLNGEEFVLQARHLNPKAHIVTITAFATSLDFELGRLFQIHGPEDDFTSCFVGLTPHVRAQVEAEMGHTLAQDNSFWDKVCGQNLLQFLRESVQTPPNVLPLYERPLLPDTRRGGFVS